MASLAEMELDSASNYMSGQVTSVFAQATEGVIVNDTVQNATNLASSALGSTTNAINIVVNADDTIANITTTCFNTLSDCVMTNAGKAVKSILDVSTMPQEIITYANEYFNANKKDLGDVLKNIFNSPEKTASESDTQNKELATNNMISKVKETASKINKNVNDTLIKASEKLEWIMSYAAQGQQWVSDKVNEWATDTVSYINSKVEEKLTKATNDKNAFIESQGTKIGKQLVETYNKGIDKAAEEIRNKTNNSVAKAKIQAKEALQSASLQIMAKIGVYISV